MHFQRCVVLVIPGHFSEMLGLPPQEHRRICLREGQNHRNETYAREDGEQPEQPSPRDARNRHPSSSQRTEGGASERLSDSEYREVRGKYGCKLTATAKNVNASPRISLFQRSVTRPPELVKGAAAKMPESKRKMMMLAVFWLSAHPT